MGRRLTITHEGRRHVLGWDGANIELWRRSRIRDSALGTFGADQPGQEPGQEAALAAFFQLEPGGMALADQPPRTFQPRPVHPVPAIVGVLVLVSVLVTAGVFAVAQGTSSRHGEGSQVVAATNPGWVYRDGSSWGMYL
jgi:hypothetical protein